MYFIQRVMVMCLTLLMFACTVHADWETVKVTGKGICDEYGIRLFLNGSNKLPNARYFRVDWNHDERRRIQDCFSRKRYWVVTLEGTYTDPLLQTSLVLPDGLESYQILESGEEPIVDYLQPANSRTDMCPIQEGIQGTVWKIRKEWVLLWKEKLWKLKNISEEWEALWDRTLGLHQRQLCVTLDASTTSHEIHIHRVTDIAFVDSTAANNDVIKTELSLQMAVGHKVTAEGWGFRSQNPKSEYPLWITFEKDEIQNAHQAIGIPSGFVAILSSHEKFPSNLDGTERIRVQGYVRYAFIQQRFYITDGLDELQ